MTSASSPPPEWRPLALCSQVDPELWYPEKGGSTQAAKKICRRCPVRPECFDYAMEVDDRFGVWGGYSDRERKKLKRLGVERWWDIDAGILIWLS